jgi:hypothetical protein
VVLKGPVREPNFIQGIGQDPYRKKDLFLIACTSEELVPRFSQEGSGSKNRPTTSSAQNSGTELKFEKQFYHIQFHTNATITLLPDSPVNPDLGLELS